MNAKEKLIDSFFHLLTIKEFNNISISELCLLSKVHRTTFYNYYDNLFDLLIDAKNKAINELDNEFKEINNNTNFDYMSENTLVTFLEFIKKYPNLFKTYFVNSEILDSTSIFNDLLNNKFIPNAKKHGFNDEEEIKLASIFFIHGITSILLYWIDSNFKLDSKTLSKIILGFIVK